jgi:ribose transport system permease protein
MTDTQRSTTATMKPDRVGRTWAERFRDPHNRGIALPIVGVLGLAIYFTMQSPGFVSTQNFSLILLDAAVLLIVAIGASWVIVMGSIDLSNGAIVILAGFVVGTFVQSQPVWVAILIGLAVAACCGALNGVLFAYLRLPSFLVTLGSSMILTGIGLVFVGGRTVQIFNPQFTSISQGEIIPGLPNVVLWALVIFVIETFVGFRTRFGRYTLLIGGGEQVANLSGIPVRRYKFYAFLVSGILSGIAGVLLASRLSSASPGVGGDLMLLSIAAVVMSGTPLTGGIGGAHRTILGVLVISMLNNGLSGMGVGPFERNIIQGIVVIVAVASTIDRSRLSVLK